MGLIPLVPANTKIDFVRMRYAAFAFSIIVIAGSLLALATEGLNYGIDFRGGFLIEIRTPQVADIALLRTSLSALNLGEVKLQEAGGPRDVMIRIEKQKGGDEAQQEALTKIKAALGKDVEYRRIETVGPKVSEDLINNGLIAVGLAMLAMLVYIWFRYEWQFGVCGVLALLHDCLAILGLYAVSPLEFNETSLIAILTTLGYSINDTVVIYDRLRENFRKYKKMPLPELLNLSMNETLSRTTLTVATTLLSLLALYLFGGKIIAEFSLPIIFGITFGTYSSIFISSLLLLYFKFERDKEPAASTPVTSKKTALPGK
jgi:preprotein translocase SecF subunit